MSTEPRTTERLRSVLLAALMVCSIVAGSVAVAGSATADFDTTSADLTTTDDTADDGTNSSDSENGTENETTTHSGEATAGPDSVGVTAGAAGQAPVATADVGAATLRFAEDEPNGFPVDGTVTLTLPEDTGVTFDTEASSVSVAATNGTVSGTTLSERELSITVDTDDGAETELAVEGLRFVAAADADAVDATWSFGNATGTTTVEPERMTAAGFGSVVPRGAHGAPEGGTGFSLQPDQGAARTEGFHERGDFVAVFIAEEYADRLAFDRSSTEDLEIRTSNRCHRDNLVESTGTRNAYVQDGVLFFRVYCQLNHDDYLTVQNVRFNATGATLDEAPDFDAVLDVKYDPVNNTDSTRIAADGDTELSVRSPTIDRANTTVQRGANGTTGEEPVSVTVSDEHGGMIADGSQLTLSLVDGEGVSFNESQRVEVVSESDSFSATVADVTADSVVLDVDGDSSAGDSLTVRGANDSGLTFDVGENASETDLAVTTNAGGDDVIQSAGSVKVAESASDPDEDDESGDDDGGDDESGDDDGGDDESGDDDEDGSNGSDDNTDDGTEETDDGPGNTGDSAPSSGGSGSGAGGGGGAPASDSSDDSEASTPTPTASGSEGTLTPADDETETPSPTDDEAEPSTPADDETETSTPTAAPSGVDTGGNSIVREAAGLTGSLGNSVLLGSAIVALLLLVSGVRLYRRNDSL